MSTLRCNTIQDTAGVERFLARAWVNFNGTGTVAIRAAGNVSSITDNGVGNYTINFTNAMPDANYTVALGGDNNGVVDGVVRTRSNFTYSTTGVTLLVANTGGSVVDIPVVNATIFR